MRHIVFGYQPNWAPIIARTLDHARFRPAFAPLDRVDLDRFDAALPLDPSHYRELAHRPDLFGRKFVHPTPAVTALCDDKLLFARHLIEVGFAAYIPALLDGDTATYPRIRRPRIGSDGKGAYLLAARADDSTARTCDSGLFDQAFIPGRDEYVLHVLKVAGRLRYAGALRYEMAGAHQIRGRAQPALSATPIDPNPALDWAEPILAHLGYEGTACLNYKLLDGRPLLMELNPRFGGSLTGDITRYVEAYVQALER